MGRKPQIEEPYWAPLPRQHFSTGQAIGIFARHLVPLIGVLFFGASAGQFLLLSVFNIAFTVACIGTIGVGVSMRKENGPSPNLADEIAAWVSLLAVCIFVSLLLTTMFGWVIAIFASAENPQGLFNASLAWSVLAIVASAAPGVFQQYRADLRSPMTETQRKQRDQPNVLVHVLCAGLMFIMSGYAPGLGRFGLVLMAIAVTALFIFRDLRPDLMRELTRPKNRPPSSD